MLLYVLRHGIAEDDSPTGDDADRRLTAAGEKKTRKIVAALAARIGKKARPQLVLTSGKARARRTAELAAEAFAVNLDDWPMLADNDADAILAVLDELSEIPAAMIVGHEPSLSAVIARLCHAPEGSIRLKKAGCAALDVPCAFGRRTDEPATLLWLTTPKLLVG